MRLLAALSLCLFCPKPAAVLLLAGDAVARLLLLAARASEAAADSECHYSDMSEALLVRVCRRWCCSQSFTVNTAPACLGQNAAAASSSKIAAAAPPRKLPYLASRRLDTRD